MPECKSEWMVEFVQFIKGGYADACTHQSVNITLSEEELRHMLDEIQKAKEARI